MAITSPEPGSTSLTFPPQHYAKLSPSSFLYATLSSSALSHDESPRPNGRTRSQFRPATVNTSSLTNANGSAVIRLGSTSAVCGVRAELLPVSSIHGGLPPELENWAGPSSQKSDLENARSDADVIAELSLLVPNLELSTGCNPTHLPGNAPSTEAQSLTQRLVSLLKTTDLVPLHQLLVWHKTDLPEDDGAMATDNPNDPGQIIAAGREDDATRVKYELKAIWTLYIDILYISLDGSAFSGAWLALLAALKDTELPLANWDEDREMLMCSPVKKDTSPLQLGPMPVCLSGAVFSHAEDGHSATWLLHDADDFEEAISEGEVTIVVARGGSEKTRKGSGRSKETLLRLEAGGIIPDEQSIRGLVAAASDRLKEWNNLLQWN